MKGITYQATFGHEIKTVDISEVSGTGGLWFLTVNKFHQAQFSRRQGSWVCSFQRPDGWVTASDLQVLCEIVKDLAEK